MKRRQWPSTPFVASETRFCVGVSHVSDTPELTENPAISSWVRDAYEVLLRWARDCENSTDYRKLDAITHAFDEAGVAFARPMFNAGVARQHAIQLEVARVALTAERDGLAGQYTALAEDREKLASRLGEAEANYDRIQNERGALAAERDQLSRDRDALGQERDVVGQERDAFAGRLSVIETELANANAESAAAFIRAAGLEAELGNVVAGVDELKHHKAVAESTLRQREEEIAQLNSALDHAKEQARRNLEMRAEFEAALNVAEGRLDEHFSETARLSELILEQDIALARVQADLDQARDQSSHDAELIAANAAALGAAESRLDEHFDETARLSELILEQDIALARVQADLDQARDQSSHDAELIAANAAALGAAESRLDEHFDETARLSQILREREVRLAAEIAKGVWLQKVTAVRIRLPRWWMIMPSKWRLRWEHRRLSRRGLFDASAYLERYPDVATSGLDPVNHYMIHGIDENRETTRLIRNLQLKRCQTFGPDQGLDG